MDMHSGGHRWGRVGAVAPTEIRAYV